MQTKSKIQLIRECLMLKEEFFNSVKNIVEKYTVMDSVFSFKDSKIEENVNGYMNIRGEYDTLEEAFKNLEYGESIRIVENKSYQIGTICKSLKDTKSDKVYDIESSSIISE